MRPRFYPTPAHLDWLRQHRASGTLAEITARFNAHFGRGLTTGQLNTALARHAIRAASDGRFRHGNTPRNKGKSYRVSARSIATRWKPGHVPISTVPVGSYRQVMEGYWQIKIADSAKPGLSRKNWAFVHRLTWEAANGPLPDGMSVIFLDGDLENCLDPDNLVAVDRATLLRLNHSGFNAIKDRDERRALVALCQLQSAAHRAARDVGMSKQERSAAIPAVRRQHRSVAL